MLPVILKLVENILLPDYVYSVSYNYCPCNSMSVQYVRHTLDRLFLEDSMLVDCKSMIVRNHIYRRVEYTRDYSMCKLCLNDLFVDNISFAYRE